MNKRQRKKHLKKLRTKSFFSFAECLGWQAMDWQIKAMEVLTRELKSAKFQKHLMEAHRNLMLSGRSVTTLIYDDDIKDVVFTLEPVMTQQEVDRIKSSIPSLRIDY